MKLFPKKIKDQRNSEAYSYFGEFGETPVAVSLFRAVEASDFREEPRHYSQSGHKIFVVTAGSIEVEVNDQTFMVDPDHALMIEPKEIHRVLAVSSLPCTYVVFGTVKDPTGADKVILK